MTQKWKVSFWIPFVFPCVGVLCAQSIPNWSAPPYWSAAKSHSGGISVQDITNPLPFVGLTPCRIADTRGNGFMGQYGPPSLTQGSLRNFTLAGQCGIPIATGAVSLNITVTNTAGPGFILIYPQGGVQPTVSTLNYIAGQTVANAAVVPLGTGGGISVVAGVSGTDLIIDTNGYYYDSTKGSGLLTSGEYFGISGNVSNNGLFYGLNNSTGAGAHGGLFVTASPMSSSAGAVGQAIAGSGQASGVWGITGSTSFNTAGVKGWALPPNLGSLNFARAGVRGESGAGLGVLGLSDFIGVDGFLLNGSGNILASGLLGSSLNSRTSGVLGFLSTSAGDTAGVLGINGTGSPVSLPLGFSTAGVRGEGDLGTGVLGISRSNGVVGVVTDNMGVIRATGYLGTLVGGFYTAVYAAGNLEVTGVKNFVEPHPTDASKVIAYASLEGREVGTYFRGTARTEGGRAVLEIPEDFRIVTDEEGLTVQLTPIRSFASMYVESEDLNQILVRSSKDVTFHYLVQGVRRAFKDFQPLRNGEEFMPTSATSRMPGSMTEEARRRLIANGAYNSDGTVNLETARRLGWTRIWQEREEQAKAAAARTEIAVERRQE